MLRGGWRYVLLLLILVACSKAEEKAYAPSFSEFSNGQVKEYVVGIHPLHNPQRLMELYGPIIEYININMPEAHFRLEASRNYEEFDKKLYSGYFDFAMPNPYQTVRSLKYGYRIFAKMGNDEDFRGIILVRKDSKIHEVSDLKGKIVSYPALTALAATMMPQYYLHTHGINVNTDIENRYVGSQESSILSVLRGHVAAGATWPTPWKAFRTEHPEQASQLEVKWQTEPLQNNGWVVRNDVSVSIANKFQVLLFDLNQSEDGQRILQRLPITHFEPATDETYQPVLDFLDAFSKQVRKVER
ncbi:MAG: phosphate/phosphite/phosphonate ABC transporter substrate-binding protein [Methylotenera sp.]|nr:phosphate/phosphite/phosphonate ABC transporter substrate-binding protein [Methylotenera sp.]